MPTEIWTEHSELDRSLAVTAAVKTIFLILNDKDLLEREKLKDYHSTATKHVEALGGESAVKALDAIFEPLHQLHLKT